MPSRTIAIPLSPSPYLNDESTIIKTCESISYQYYTETALKKQALRCQRNLILRLYFLNIL